MGRSSVAAGGTVYYGASRDPNSEADRLAGLQELMAGFAGRITYADRAGQTSGTANYSSLYFKYSWMNADNCFAACTYSTAKGYQFTIYVSGTGDVYAFFRQSRDPSEIISSPEWRGYRSSGAASNEATGMPIDYNGTRNLAIANVALHPIGSNAEATRAMVEVGTTRPLVWGRDIITSGTTIRRTPLSTPSSSESANAGKIIVLGPIFAATTGGVSANARMVVMSDNTLGPGSYQIGGIPYQFVGVDSGNDSGTQAALALRGSKSTVSTD